MAGRIHFGVAGWSYPDWAGIVHPATLRGGPRLLEHMAGLVDLLEINVTFYRPVPAATVARWAAVAARHPHLLFSAKLHRDFSHGPPAAFAAADLAPFVASLAPLVEAGRLAAVLVQLPVSARADAAERSRLERLVPGLSPLPVALEVRHRSWLEPAPLAQVQALGVSLVHLDLPAARDHIPADLPVVGALGYLRLHGRHRAAWFRRGAGRDERYDHLYAPDELLPLLARLRRLAGASDRVLLVANNHPRGQAVAAALELKARHEERPVPAPLALVERYPQLRPWTVPQGQLGLFG